MRAVRRSGTQPEHAVQRALTLLGIHYVVGDGGLPGSPDLVDPEGCWVIFVHGCFWHGHNCSLVRTPSRNRKYWVTKIADNKRRDRRVSTALRRGGWLVLTVWECRVKRAEFSAWLTRRIEAKRIPKPRT